MDKQDSNKPASKVFIFGKTSIEALPIPAKGKRTIHKDQKYPYLFLRNTPTGKTFYFQQTIKGRQITITIAKYGAINSDQARDRAKDIAASYVKGEDVQQEALESRTEKTLGEVWQDFRVNRKRGKGRISEAHEYNWNRHFKHWQNKQLSTISYDMARKLILDIRKTAPVHANRVQRLGKAIWNHAIIEMRVNKGKKVKVENPFTFSQESEKGRERKTFRLQKSQMPAFFKALDSLPGSNMKDLFLVSLFTGRRIGEVKSMSWLDVDLVSGIWGIPDTKSGERQNCVLPKQVVQILTNRKPQDSDDFNQWVFPTNSKSGHVEAVNTAWEQVRFYGLTKKERKKLKRLHEKVVSGKATDKQVERETELQNKTKFQHLQARDLRGTLASWFQDEGGSISAAAAQLGHADISTTEKNYISVAMQVQRIGLDTAVNAMLEAAK